MVARVLAAPGIGAPNRILYEDAVTRRSRSTWLDSFLKRYEPCRSISRDAIVARLRKCATDGVVATLLPHEARSLVYHVGRTDAEWLKLQADKKAVEDEADGLRMRNVGLNAEAAKLRADVSRLSTASDSVSTGALS